MKDDGNLKLIERLLLYILTGMCCGITITLYRVSIQKVAKFMKYVLSISNENMISRLIFILIFLFIGLAVYCLNNSEPMIKGSGIPVIYGLVDDKIKVNCKKTLIYKFLTSIVTVGMGLTLGREGPSVQIGGLVGKLVHSLTKRKKIHKKYFIGSSSGAGLAVAFNAPLTGVLFSIEEIYKKTTRKEFLSSAVNVFSAVICSDVLIGVRPALVNIPKIKYLSLNVYGYVVLFGIIVGLSGVLFNYVTINGTIFVEKIKINPLIKFLIPFFVTAIFLLMDSNLFGAGENLIMLPLENNANIPTLIYYYFVKLFLIFLVFSTSVPGGSLVPLLVLGSLVGNIFASVLCTLGILDKSMILVFSMIGMAGHFSSIVRSPITAVILVLEMTGGSFDYLLAIAIVCVIAYTVAELLKVKPFYEKCYEILKEKINEKNKNENNKQINNQIIV